MFDRLPGDRPSDSEDFLREYARQVAIIEDAAARGVPGAPRALTDLHRAAGRTLDHLTHGPAPTRAWPMHPDLRPGHERTEGEPRD